MAQPARHVKEPEKSNLPRSNVRSQGNRSLPGPVSVSGKRDFEARDLGSGSLPAFPPNAAKTFPMLADPRNAGLSLRLGKSLHMRECVVADAVAVEPVSASEFPATGKITGRFHPNSRPMATANEIATCWCYLQADFLRTRTGNYFARTKIIFIEQGMGTSISCTPVPGRPLSFLPLVSCERSSPGGAGRSKAAAHERPPSILPFRKLERDIFRCLYPLAVLDLE